MELILDKCGPEGLNREDIQEQTLFDSILITLHLHFPLTRNLFFPFFLLFPSIAVNASKKKKKTGMILEILTSNNQQVFRIMLQSLPFLIGKH